MAQHGTVTAAAESLHMTPSAASQRVRKLQRDLGVVLVERRGRGVRLTAVARSLIGRAEEIQARWQEVEAELHAAAGKEPVGVVRLCAFPTAAAALLARTVTTLQGRHPELVVRVREAESAECFDLLFADDADLAVVEAAPTNPSAGDRRFDQCPLLDDPFDVFVCADHPLADRCGIRLDELADQSWIMGMAGSSCRQHILAACTSAGFSPTVAHEARDWNLVSTLVGHGLGIALIPRLARVPPDLNVVRLPLCGSPAPARKLLTCTRRGSRDHPAIAAAARALRELT